MFEGEGYEGLATAVMTCATQRVKAPLILNTPNGGATRISLGRDIAANILAVDANQLPGRTNAFIYV